MSLLDEIRVDNLPYRPNPKKNLAWANFSMAMSGFLASTLKGLRVALPAIVGSSICHVANRLVHFDRLDLDF